MVTEIQVAGFVEGHQVNMCVRHINANHCNAHLNAGAYFLESLGNSTAETMQLNEEFIIEVEYIIHLLFRNAKHMTFDYRIHIKESQTIIGFIDLVAGNLARHYT